MDYEEKIRLSRDEKTSPEVLEELSSDESWEIRSHVAENPSAPESALIRLSQDNEELSKDEDWEIRSCVASNCSTPERGLIRLSRDRDYYIRYKAIKNKNCGGILKEMVRVKSGGEEKVDWYEFGRNMIWGRTDLRFLKGWEERYFS